jgi:hypothetical protein
MKNINDAELMATDYVSQVYPGLDKESSQFKESEQHFLMGIWALLQLLNNKNFNLSKVQTIENEIREYQTKRLSDLGYSSEGKK